MPLQDEYGNVFYDEGDAEVTAPDGTPIIVADSDPSGEGGAVGALYDLIKIGVPNGNFSSPPRQTDLALDNDINRLPYWSWSVAVASTGSGYPTSGGGAIVPGASGYWVQPVDALAYSPPGIKIVSDPTVTLDAYVVQIVSAPIVPALSTLVVRAAVMADTAEADTSMYLNVKTWTGALLQSLGSASATLATVNAAGEYVLEVLGDPGDRVLGLSITVGMTRTAGAESVSTAYILKVEAFHRQVVGLMPFAFSLGSHHGAIVQTEANLAAVSGGLAGAWATPMAVSGPMLLSSFTLANRNTSALREAEWRLYVDTGSNTLNQVSGVSGTFSFTPVANSVRTSSLSTPVLIAPGLYWVVLRNTSTAQTFSIGFMNAGVLTTNTSRDNTAEAALSSTIDISAWTANTPLPLFRLGGRIGAEAADF